MLGRLDNERFEKYWKSDILKIGRVLESLFEIAAHKRENSFRFWRSFI
jgi:hypothetical protein